MITTNKRFSEWITDARSTADIKLDLKGSKAREENLKNLLMGLNVKMTSYVDQKEDLKQTQSMLG